LQRIHEIQYQRKLDAASLHRNCYIFFSQQLVNIRMELAEYYVAVATQGGFQ